MVKFIDIKNGKISSKELGKFFYHNSEMESLLKLNEKEIVFDLLKMINFRELKFETGTIESYCLKIFSCYQGKVLEYNRRKYEPIEAFYQYFLPFRKLPISIKNELEKKVKIDLSKVELLIDEYSQEDYIIRFINKADRPRKHSEAVLLEFYTRTKNKKNEILNYFLYQLDLRAINKAAERTKEEAPYLEYDIKSDFPYLDTILKGTEFKYEINWEYLDLRKINLFRNKFWWTGEYMEVYKYDKNAYDTLRKKIKIDLVFKTLIKNASSFESLRKRVPILRELQFLYNASKFYGFYALCLPQLEGIFTDMILSIQHKSSSGSISDKVNIMRNYYDDSEFYFDYYQYYIPDLRNKFSHLGKDTDIKSKSLFVLLDLHHLVTIFAQINSNVVNLEKLMKKEVSYYKHIGVYREFLVTLNKVHKEKKLTALSKKVSDFKKKLFVNDSKIISWIKYLIEDYNYSFMVLSKEIYRQSGKEINLVDMDKYDVVQSIDKINQVFKESLAIIIQEPIKVLFNTNEFITLYTKFCDKLNPELDKLIEVHKKNNKLTIEKTSYLSQKLIFKIPEYFWAKVDELKHISKF